MARVHRVTEGLRRTGTSQRSQFAEELASGVDQEDRPLSEGAKEELRSEIAWMNHLLELPIGAPITRQSADS